MWIGDGRVAASTQVWRSDLALDAGGPLRRVATGPGPAPGLRIAPGGLPGLARGGILAAPGSLFVDCVVLVMLFGMICQWKHWEVPVLPEVINKETFQHFMDQYLVFARMASPYLFLLIAAL